MRLLDDHAMLYLLKHLYKKFVAEAERRDTSLPALRAGFGLWKDMDETGIEYEDSMRRGWTAHPSE